MGVSSGRSVYICFCCEQWVVYASGQWVFPLAEGQGPPSIKIWFHVTSGDISISRILVSLCWFCLNMGGLVFLLLLCDSVSESRPSTLERCAQLKGIFCMLAVLLNSNRTSYLLIHMKSSVYCRETTIALMSACVWADSIFSNLNSVRKCHPNQ